MDALIFDFDGVLVDSEPIHFAGFSGVLKEYGIDLKAEAYYEKYLGYDDHDCFEAVFEDNGKKINEELIAKMTAQKTRVVQKAIIETIQPLPGAIELVQAAETAALPLAICSGALRQEIELAAKTVKIWEHFMTVVSAEDVARGKPDPEGYRRALEQLSQLTGRVLLASRTVVVEDSPTGIFAAKELGMMVLGVTSSYDDEALEQADLIVDSLENVKIADLERMVN